MWLQLSFKVFLKNKQSKNRTRSQRQTKRGKKTQKQRNRDTKKPEMRHRSHTPFPFIGNLFTPLGAGKGGAYGKIVYLIINSIIARPVTSPLTSRYTLKFLI